MAVNESLAELSDNFLYSAIGVYAGAMFVYAAEWGLGSRSRVGRQAGALRSTRDGADSAGGGAGAATTTTTTTTATDTPSLNRADRLGGIAVSLTVLAFGLHLVAVLLGAIALERVPWSNMYQFSTASALVATGVYLALLTLQDLRWLGVFVVTLVELTLWLAVTVLRADAEELIPSLRSYWLVIHVSAAVVASGLFTLGALTSALYLLRRWRARRAGQRPGGLLDRLPSAVSLDRLSYRLHAVAFPIWTFAVVAGAIWAARAWGRYWGWDPKEVWAFITWVVYAAYLHARATAGWRGQKAAIVAIVGYVTFLFNYFGVNIVFNSLHSYAGL